MSIMNDECARCKHLSICGENDHGSWGCVGTMMTAETDERNIKEKENTITREEERKKLIDERIKNCPWRCDNNGCTCYSGIILLCEGACAWVVDYLKEKDNLKNDK